MRPKALFCAALGATSVIAGLAGTAAQASTGPDPTACLSGSRDRQAVFTRAADTSKVPVDVLLAVSYLESRWDDHGGSPSTSGGYGPMHLTAGAAPDVAAAKGDGASPTGADHDDTGTLATAARLSGIPEEQARTDDVANVCAGAALLASYRPADATGWTEAVARYSGSADEATASRFAQEVFDTLRTGQSRQTNDGYRVVLTANPDARLDPAAIQKMGLSKRPSSAPDCPPELACDWLPAPYEQYGTSPGAYGNHDLADRPHDMKIDYIVIHDTEANWKTTLDLVTRPTNLAWQYSIRSSDGLVTNHMSAKDVGWQAGNWYVNMHSIGIEHEGFAASGATWFTESMYRSSATLVRYLSSRYHVPLDRAHVIGHDQVPGVLPANVRGMHWDPGPYWDWEHYFDLLGAPIGEGGTGGAHARGDVVTVAPGFADNTQPVTGCTSAGTPCPTQGTNFVYLHTQPSADSPLVSDIGLRPDGKPSTTAVSDIGARVAAGQQLVVAERRGDWLGVWYLGELAWLHNPAEAPTVVAQRAMVLESRTGEAVPVYGRAYPEQAAYPVEIPYQTVAPLQYTIKPGQSYVVADRNLQTDYYYAKTFNCASVPLDCTQVVGRDRYYEIWFGHRMAFVRADDVVVRPATAQAP
jgi:hypothetical protein